MAASYISVPRDLTKVKSKVMFNLTKRQLICFGMAVLIGVWPYPGRRPKEECGTYGECLL